MEDLVTENSLLKEQIEIMVEPEVCNSSLRFSAKYHHSRHCLCALKEFDLLCSEQEMVVICLALSLLLPLTLMLESACICSNLRAVSY